AKYTALNQSMGMRFHVDEAILKAFHRHAGEVDLAAISPDVVVAFFQPRHRVTSTWLMKHRALRRFYQHAITRGLVARSPVPTAPQLARVLAEYVDAVPAGRGPAPTAFFVNRGGGPIPHQTVRGTFASLRERVGVPGRLHDLRHTFAVHRLLAWYREGADVQ